MKCLVTGGTGFVGSHLALQLLKRSYRTTVADRRDLLKSPTWQISKDSPNFVQIDLRNYQNTKSLILDCRPDLVFHLAAQPISAKSNVDPLGTFHDNVTTTYNILEAIREIRPSCKVVHASSACFYGVPIVSPPLREEDPPAVGGYIYTATKIAADFAVQHYMKVFGLKCIAVRMVNVYGPGDTNIDRIIPRLAIQAVTGSSPTLTQSDGSDVLSFLYIDDAVNALLSLGLGAEGFSKPVWNIGGGSPIQIVNLMRLVFKLEGRSVQSFSSVGPRINKSVHKFLDGEQFNTRFHLKRVVDLESGLSQTLRWVKNNLDSLLKYKMGVTIEGQEKAIAAVENRQ